MVSKVVVSPSHMRFGLAGLGITRVSVKPFASRVSLISAGGQTRPHSRTEVLSEVRSIATRTLATVISSPYAVWWK